MKQDNEEQITTKTIHTLAHRVYIHVTESHTQYKQSLENSPTAKVQINNEHC